MAGWWRTGATRAARPATTINGRRPADPRHDGRRSGRTAPTCAKGPQTAVKRVAARSRCTRHGLLRPTPRARSGGPAGHDDDPRPTHPARDPAHLLRPHQTRHPRTHARGRPHSRRSPARRAVPIGRAHEPGHPRDRARRDRDHRVGHWRAPRGPRYRHAGPARFGQPIRTTTLTDRRILAADAYNVGYERFREARSVGGPGRGSARVRARGSGRPQRDHAHTPRTAQGPATDTPATHQRLQAHQRLQDPHPPPDPTQLDRPRPS